MEFWRGKKVLVTGGAGFIGSHLSERLVQLGARVRVVDNLVRGRLENLASVADAVEFIKGDLTSEEMANRACAGMEIVFHLASKVGGIGYYLKCPAEVYENNLIMDAHVFKAARLAGCLRFLFSSSAHVYPKHLQSEYDSPPLKEAAAYPANPAISYGWAKLATERLIQYQNEEKTTMQTAIVRIVGAFGERQDFGLDTGSVIPVFCRRAIEFPGRSPFTMLGKGNETRSYCYVGDVVEGMIQCVLRLSVVQKIPPINLGTEGRVSILEVAKLVIGLSGKEIGIEHLPAMESGIKGQAVDMSRAKVEIPEWSAKVSLRDGILKAYRDIELRLRRGGE